MMIIEVEDDVHAPEAPTETRIAKVMTGDVMMTAVGIQSADTKDQKTEANRTICAQKDSAFSKDRLQEEAMQVRAHT